MATVARVLIIGGGFGGVTAALELRKRAPQAEIVLVNAEDQFTFYPSLYEYAASSVRQMDIALPLNAVLEKRGVTFFHDTVIEIDFSKKSVTTARKHVLHFDYLVLALGSMTNYYGVPGARENTLPLKTKEDAEDLYEELKEIQSTGKPVQIVICGGGLTGVEFGAELADFLHEQCETHNTSCARNLTLIHLGDKLVPEFPQYSALVLEKLTRKGIIVKLSEPVQKIMPGKVITSKGEYPADLILWAGGIKPHPVTEKLGIDMVAQLPGFAGRAMPGGGLVVNQFLQTYHYPFVFGVGDCVSPLDPKTDKPVIKTAQNAIQEGEVAARNIATLIRSASSATGVSGAAAKPPKLVTFIPKRNFALFTLGRHDAVFEHLGVTLKGRVAHWLKRFIEKGFWNRIA